MTQAVFALQLADTAPGAANVACVTGEIDVTNAEEFAESVLGLPGDRPVVVDVSRLRYLNSAGFAALDRLLAERGAVIVIEPTSLIRRAAVVMELPFHPDTDTDAAVQAVATGA